MMDLFETTEINGMKLPNRFVRSATWEGMAADDGAVTPGLIKIDGNREICQSQRVFPTTSASDPLWRARVCIVSWTGKTKLDHLQNVDPA